jgi:hypothetical protein
MLIASNPAEFSEVSLSSLMLGEAALTFLPAEAFVEFGLTIKQRSPFAERTIVSAYNDCSLEYIPTESAFSEGEFEVNGGWRYIAPGSGELITATALETLGDLDALKSSSPGVTA